jgi:ferritin
MLSPAVEKALNSQLNEEFFSAYLYLALSAHFETIDLPGMARWMRMQAQEEALHAMKIYDYVVNRDGRVRLDAIKRPEGEWESPQAIFESVLEHEQSVTQSIHDLVSLAGQEKDHATHNFLQWFVAEQVEEEASANEVLSQVRLVGGNGQGLFLIDRELASRKLTAEEGGV